MMEKTMELLTIFFAAVLINNIVLSQYLGLCVYMGVSRKVSPSIGIGIAAIFIMGSSSFLSWLLYTYILKPLGLEFLNIIVFVLLVSGLVQFTETYAKKMSPKLYHAVGIYLILLASNCAVLAPPLRNVEKAYPLLESIVNGAGLGIGFGLAIVLFSFIRERLEFSDVPESFRGLPIAFITTGLLALAFMGFSGMVKM
jgi:Na+-translocating ferredoxin:NAD+ oxidoreductase subunit A